MRHESLPLYPPPPVHTNEKGWPGLHRTTLCDGRPPVIDYRNAEKGKGKVRCGRPTFSCYRGTVQASLAAAYSLAQPSTNALFTPSQLPVP